LGNGHLGTFGGKVIRGTYIVPKINQIDPKFVKRLPSVACSKHHDKAEMTSDGPRLF
jgi:hypothetical protein